MKKTIVIACGSGIATSTMIANRVEAFLEDNGIDGEIIQCNIIEVDGYEDRADVIISSTQLQKEYQCPTVMGLGFISGVGVEEIEEELLKILKD